VPVEFGDVYRKAAVRAVARAVADGLLRAGLVWHV
jgi:hypothetical protein